MTLWTILLREHDSGIMRMEPLREHDIMNHHYNYHYDIYMHIGASIKPFLSELL